MNKADRYRVSINIHLDNAAFDEDPAAAVAKLLSDLSESIDLIGLEQAQGNLRDFNGNVSGTYRLIKCRNKSNTKG